VAAVAFETVRRDFDRIAVLSAEREDAWPTVLARWLPARAGRALDVGCGTGAFARALAPRCDSVLGLDLSPEMIRLARARAEPHANVRFEVADVLEYGLPHGAFDLIVSVTTLHHLPFERTLGILRDALTPNGRLIVHDLWTPATVADFSRSLIGTALQTARAAAHPAKWLGDRELRRAWREHGAHDRYSTVPEVRRRAADVLPGARVVQHLAWRYTLLFDR
jgi:SAM-dependent methyltransferase